MRIKGTAPQLTNFRGKIDRSHPGYHELNLQPGMVFDPRSLIECPRCSATFTCTSDSPVYLHAAKQALEVRSGPGRPARPR